MRTRGPLESLSFTFTANCKRQIQVENFWIENEQLKTILMNKKLSETTNLGVEIKSNKRQVKRKLGHLVQIPVWRKRDAWTSPFTIYVYVKV